MQAESLATTALCCDRCPLRGVPKAGRTYFFSVGDFGVAACETAFKARSVVFAVGCPCAMCWSSSQPCFDSVAIHPCGCAGESAGKRRWHWPLFVLCRQPAPSSTQLCGIAVACARGLCVLGSVWPQPWSTWPRACSQSSSSLLEPLCEHKRGVSDLRHLQASQPLFVSLSCSRQDNFYIRGASWHGTIFAC